MTEFCLFCSDPLNPHDLGVYKQVIGWVHGKKSDGMVLREYTEHYAHERCIRKQLGGQAPDQPDLFGEETTPESSYASMESDIMVDAIESILEPGEPVKPRPSFDETMGEPPSGTDPEEGGYF